MWIAGLLTDEAGSASNKRLTCLLCTLALIAALGISMLSRRVPPPVAPDLLVEALAGLALGAMGLTSMDKSTKRRGPATSATTTTTTETTP